MHILIHLVIVNTLERSCTLDMSVKIKCIIIINNNISSHKSEGEMDELQASIPYTQ